ncbi:hypothetical protein L6164_005472 [Bauhinia variegata]|uniref:Uncharacterized protein n=1 Tax=Bauhinia variegata TaxID=167791 RepID=A0ACB9PRF0_BAUVA|nr:hypothetical protein L6164_005472 [Bauhinia variegata]
MSEDVPSTAIAKMRNALLPSWPSPIHCHGNNIEHQMENLMASTHMDDLIHFHNSACYMGSKIFNNGSQLGNGSDTMYTQSHSFIDDYNHHSGSLHGISNSKDVHMQSFLLSKQKSISQYEGDRGNERKRPHEFIDNMSMFKKLKNNPKNKMPPILEPKWYQTLEYSQEIHGHKLQLPVRRRQKLTDKIKSLQKLVSPYGKTDTASVLHEASLYIKLLQEQIQNLYQMLGFSYTTVKTLHTEGCREREVDLRSKGLCLVPISITQKVTIEDKVDHDANSKRIFLPRKF